MVIENPVILFDGVCNLCNGTVNFILKYDKRKNFRFASLQSDTGKQLLHKFKIKSDINSVVLIHQNKIFIESEAALEIAHLLSFPWKFALILKIIPKNFRNIIYRWVAKNRYRWFGKRETCRLPNSEEKQFFL
jgi:predicted DCC family thiol-disulfide oxidoreductase YuxK